MLDTEPGAVATGYYVRPAMDDFPGTTCINKVECQDPVATAHGSVVGAALMIGATQRHETL